MGYAKQYAGSICVVILIIGMSTPCMAEQAPVFGGVSDILPFSYKENGVAKGFFSDLFLEAAHRAGFKVSLRLFPVKRLWEYLESGKIDGCVTLVPTKAREEYLIFSTSPLLKSYTRVFVKKGREFPFASVNDLVGKKIGILIGWETENKAFNQAIKEGTVQTEEVSQQDLNLKKLMLDRIDCFIGTELLTWYRANDLGIAEHFVSLETPIGEHNVLFAVRKHSKNIANPQAFIEKMSAAIDEVVSDGTSDKLKKRYKVTPLK